MDDDVFMVRADSRAACQRELDRLCQLLDVQTATRPTDAGGRHWVARAVPVTKAPTDGRGLGVPG